MPAFLIIIWPLLLTLPAFVAFWRQHHNAVAILALLLATYFVSGGWGFLFAYIQYLRPTLEQRPPLPDWPFLAAWVVAMTWAWMNPPPKAAQ